MSGHVFTRSQRKAWETAYRENKRGGITPAVAAWLADRQTGYRIGLDRGARSPVRGKCWRCERPVDEAQRDCTFCGAWL